MDLRTDSLFAGIAGTNAEVDHFEIGHGVSLRRTYAHFMAPFLMAFAPAKPGSTHPGPWSAVRGGLGFDITLELHIPASFQLPKFFDRINTIWWITALLRLRGVSSAHVPVIADRPFSDIPKNWKDTTIIPVEALPRRLLAGQKSSSISEVDLEWLKGIWIEGAQLMRDSAGFNDVFQAFDAAGTLPNPSVALLALWGALEHLFSPAKQELRFRVAANIAAYLEPAGVGRLKLHKRLIKLYDARSGVAHGTRLKSDDSWKETYLVANDVICRILRDRHVPSKDELEQWLFAPNSSR